MKFFHDNGFTDTTSTCRADDPYNNNNNNNASAAHRRQWSKILFVCVRSGAAYYIRGRIKEYNIHYYNMYTLLVREKTVSVCCKNDRPYLL